MEGGVHVRLYNGSICHAGQISSLARTWAAHGIIGDHVISLDLSGKKLGTATHAHEGRSRVDSEMLFSDRVPIST